MPREPDNRNAHHQMRMARYRERLRQTREPETDAVDAALSAALGVYRHAAATAGRERDVRVVERLSEFAERYLTAQGYAAEKARRRIAMRIRRTDVAEVARRGLEPSDSVTP